MCTGNDVELSGSDVALGHHKDMTRRPSCACRNSVNCWGMKHNDRFWTPGVVIMRQLDVRSAALGTSWRSNHTIGVPQSCSAAKFVERITSQAAQRQLHHLEQTGTVAPSVRMATHANTNTAQQVLFSNCCDTFHTSLLVDID